MTMQSLPVVPVTHYRLAGRMAVISGVSGIAAFACLIFSLVIGPSATAQGTYSLALRIHDAGIALQSLCLIPLVLALETIARRGSPGLSKATAVAAVASLILTIALLLLGFVNIVADVLYMIPQGIVGAWLVVVCRQTSKDLSRGLQRLGIVAGVGLILVSIFPIGYYLLVDPAIFHGPISDDDSPPLGTERANGLVHLALAFGTFIGCSTYPLWSALVGRWLHSRTER